MLLMQGRVDYSKVEQEANTSVAYQWFYYENLTHFLTQRWKASCFDVNSCQYYPHLEG
jgi:hypothetical protein